MSIGKKYRKNFVLHTLVFVPTHAIGYLVAQDQTRLNTLSRKVNIPTLPIVRRTTGLFAVNLMGGKVTMKIFLIRSLCKVGGSL